MTDFVVRCPNCTQGARVPFAARGRLVECPRCGLHFPAVPDAPRVPRNPLPSFAPAVPAVAEEEPEQHPPHSPHGLLVAVALLPLGVPLVWLTAGAIAGRQSVFSFAAPVAIALGVGGLCGGIAAVSAWSFAARLRAMAALVVIGYAVAGVLYFTKPTWIEVTRKLFQGFGVTAATQYQPKDRSYTVRFPGKPMLGGPGPLQNGWRLDDVARFADTRGNAPETFVAAHGFPPIEGFPLAPSDEFFNGRVREELLKSTGGKLVSEAAVPHGDVTVREYEVLMPDAVTKRFVRIARSGTKVFYLGVEGPFLSADLPQVRDFFRSFKLGRK